MKKILITGAMLAALALAAIGGARITSQDSRTVCIPPAVVQAWS